MANFDPEVANSNGFFKDPKTKADLTGKEKRVIQCSIDDTGKLIWPQVQFSDGSVGKIVYKLWTNEEKAIYKQYRANGKARIKPEKSIAKHVEVTEQTDGGTHSHVEVTEQTDGGTHSHVEVYEKPSGESTPAGSTLDYIKKCNEHLGVWLFEGIIYDLLSVKGSRNYMPIPRSLIPKEERIRFRIS